MRKMVQEVKHWLFLLLIWNVYEPESFFIKQQVQHCRAICFGGYCAFTDFLKCSHTSGWKCQHGHSRGAFICRPTLVDLFCLCVHLFLEKNPSACSVPDLTNPVKADPFKLFHSQLIIYVNFWGLLGCSGKTVHQHLLQKFSFFCRFDLLLPDGGLPIVLPGSECWNRI